MVLLGSSGVGKSCLIIQHIQGRFTRDYDATIEDVYRTTVDVNQRRAVLTVVDTAGQETLEAIRYQYLLKGKGFIFVYSITDTHSFSEAHRMYRLVRRLRLEPSIPCVLVGNKVDQRSFRAITAEKGHRLASDMGCPFFEVTAKNRLMVEEVFQGLVHRILHGNAPLPVAPPPLVSTGQSDRSAMTEPLGDVAIPAPLAQKKKKKHRCVLM